MNMKVVAKLLIIILIVSGPSFADKVNIFEFTEIELSELEVRKVRGADNKTEYSVGSNENGNYLKAVADNAASGLGKKVIINLSRTEKLKVLLIKERLVPIIKSIKLEKKTKSFEYLMLFIRTIFSKALKTVI